MDRNVVRPSVAREVEEEFSHHFDMRVRDLVAEGWSEQDARAEAARRFGNVEQLKADCRELGTRRNEAMQRRQWFDEIRQDLAYTARQFRRAPSFALIAITTLGIAIGANTAVFSVMDAVVLKPLPFPDSDELSMVWMRYLPPSGFDIHKFVLSGPEALDIQESATSFSSVAVYQTGGSRALTGEDAAAERVRVSFTSMELIETIGVPPALGRNFNDVEDAADGPPVAILGHALWTDRYGADPSIVGASILMNGVSTEVVGVMPPDYDFPSRSQAWLPLRLDRSNEGGRQSHSYAVVGRRAPGVTQVEVDAEMNVIAERWAAEYEEHEAHFPWSLTMHEEAVADAPRVLRLLLAAVGLVLLIACANVGNLLMARAERRHSEVAVRRTLGADGARIARQLSTESLVLASVAALFGLVLAGIGLRALTLIDPTALPRLDEARLNGSVLGFTAATALLTAMLFGVIPAWISSRRATARLASPTARAVGGRGRSALRRGLVAGEVGLSLVVVILAGLVVRSFEALQSTDPGMDPTDVVTFSITLPSSAYPNAELVGRDFDRLLDDFRALPGVSRAAGSTNLPFSGTGQWDFQLNDRPERQDGDVAWNAGISHVSSGYFEALGISVLRGRSLAPTDTRDAPLVAVVSETMASRYWPKEDVLGKQFGYQMDDGVPWITIVGVVPDPVTSSLGRPGYPHVYVPQSQGGISTYFVPRTLDIAVRAEGGAEAVLPALRATVQEFDSDLPVYRVNTMVDIVSASLAGPRVTTNLLGLFALVALILAAVGVYGVIAFSVAGRTREIGVRVALGAERGQITRLILSEGVRPVALGIGFGLVGAWFATRLVESQLYGVEATDPATFVSLPLVLLGVGVVASLIPAMRATRIAPTEALREE
ncbi:MAG: ABC transporter permease [Gemmatimonadota bacterium]